MNHHDIRNVLGIIGNIISFGLFLSPLPTVIRFYKNKSVEQFHPWTFLAGILNCCLWIMYGAPSIHKDSTLVWTINSVGLVLYTIYLCVYIRYAPKEKKIQAGNGLSAVAVVNVAVALPVLLAVHIIKTRTLIVGIIAVIFNIGLYASPLTVVRKVFQTKSVEFMPFWICLAGLLNGVCWTAYALLPLDIMILIGNGIGACLGLFQVGLHAWYGDCFGHRKVDGGDTKKPSEVQLEAI